ncbi:MAG: epoxyqueuosine reductase QueH [Prevotellaceae bacterium]|nr:epoxyqueuosine reductase QueH [Prevotellaceae bacterium]
MLKIETPDGGKEVLLHTCCAPCSSAIIECLLANGIRPKLFYYNPNIYPLDEYEKRKDEAKRFARLKNLDFIDADYNHAQWRTNVAGMEEAPERGCRCLRCFTLRLMETARYANECGPRLFATTLASSRWKRLDQVNEAGRMAAAHYTGTLFWEQNWRKGGLQELRGQLLKSYGFYNQLYCGCEFSMRQHPVGSSFPKQESGHNKTTG